MDVVEASKHWGNVAEWVGSLGTIAAFGVAFWLGIHELRHRRRAEEDDVVRQARLILVAEPALGATADGDRCLFVSVTNYSQAPIYDVALELAVTRGDATSRPQVEWVHLGPGESQEAELPVPTDHDQPLSSGSPEVTFMDAAGRRWRRVVGFTEPQRVLQNMPPGMTPGLLKALVHDADRRGTGERGESA